MLFTESVSCCASRYFESLILGVLLYLISLCCPISLDFPLSCIVLKSFCWSTWYKTDSHVLLILVKNLRIFEFSLRIFSTILLNPISFALYFISNFLKRDLLDSKFNGGVEVRSNLQSKISNFLSDNYLQTDLDFLIYLFIELL